MKRLIVLLFALNAFLVNASVVYWKGNASEMWSNSNNWSNLAGENTGVLPQANDTVVFNSTSTQNCTIDISIDINSIWMEDSFSNSLIQNNTLTLKEFVIKDGYFLGGSQHIKCANFSLLGGQFISTSASLEITNNYLVSGGDFIHNQGSVMFSLSSTIEGSSTFYNTIFTNAAPNHQTYTIAHGTALTITGTLYINGSYSIVLNSGDIYAKGNIVLNNSFYFPNAGDATIHLNGDTDQILENIASSSGNLPNISIEKLTGTLFLKGYIPVSGSWTYNSGSIDAFTYGSTIYFNNSNTITGSHELYNVAFSNGAPTHQNYTITSGTILTTKGTLYINGDYAIALYTGDIYAHGDVVMNNHFTYSNAGNATIHINGENNQTLDGRTNFTGNFPNITIEKSSGILYLKGIIPVAGIWKYSFGNLDASTYESTLYFSVSTGIVGKHTLHHIIFNTFSGNPKDFELSNGTEITTKGLLTIKGDGPININTGKINVHGDIDMANTSTSRTGGTGTLEINGSIDQHLFGRIVMGGSLPTISIIKNSGTFFIHDIIAVGGNWKYTSGNVDAITNNSTIAMNGTYYLGGANGDKNMKFNHLIINYNPIILSDNIYVKGNLQITSNAIFELSSYSVFLEGKWENSGSFQAGTGKVVFNGDVYQSISTRKPTEVFYDFQIDKASGELELLSPVTINNKLLFSKGILITDSIYLISFNDNATAEGASKSSFISGPTCKYGDDSFTFPIGKGTTYQPIFISAPNTSSAAITAEYFNDAAGFSTQLDTSLEEISQCEYWKVSTQSNSLVNVGLGWDMNNVCGNISTSINVQDTANVAVARFNGSQWSSLGNSLVSGDVSSGRVNSSLQSSASGYFTLGKKKQMFVAIDPCDTIHFNTISIESKYTCSATSYLFNFSTSGNSFAEYTYNWNFGNDASIPSSTSLSPEGISFVNAGTHFIYLTISSGGCDSTIIYSLNVTPKPKFSEISIQVGQMCNSSSLTFDFTTFGNTLSQYTYQWDFGGQASTQYSSEYSPSGISFSTAGEHTIFLTVSAYGCDTLFSFTFNVASMPSFNRINVVSNHACGSSTFTYDFITNGNSLSQYSYWWDFGPQAVPQFSSEIQPTGIAFPGSGSYTINLFISSNECDTTLAYTFNVASEENDLYNYGIIAKDAVDIHKESIINGGAIGVLSNLGIAQFFNNASINGDNTLVAASKVSLGQNATITNVFANEITNNGNITGNIQAFPNPLLQLPTFPIVYPGIQNSKVSGTITLPPGNYNEVTIQSNSTLILQEGIYQFENLISYNNSSIQYSRGCVVLINEKLSLGKSNKVFPENGNDDLIIFYVNRGNYASIQQGSNIEAVIVVPDGKIEIFKDCKAKGVLVAKHVFLQQNVIFDFKKAPCWAYILSNVNTAKQYKNGDTNTNINFYTNINDSLANESSVSFLNEIESIDNFILNFYPNPATYTLHISYELPNTTENAQLDFYDANGNHIKTLNSTETVANYSVDLSNFKSGVYFLQISSDQLLLSRQRFMIVR